MIVFLQIFLLFFIAGYMTFNGDWNSHYQLSRFENTEGTLYQEILHQLEPIEYTATWYNINDG